MNSQAPRWAGVPSEPGQTTPQTQKTENPHLSPDPSLSQDPLVGIIWAPSKRGYAGLWGRLRQPVPPGFPVRAVASFATC